MYMMDLSCGNGADCRKMSYKDVGLPVRTGLEGRGNDVLRTVISDWSGLKINTVVRVTED